MWPHYTAHTYYLPVCAGQESKLGSSSQGSQDCSHGSDLCYHLTGGLEFSSRVLFRLWGWDPWLLGAARHSSHLEDEMVGWHHQLSGHEFEDRVLSCALVSSRPRASSCSFQGSFNGLPDSALIRGFSYICSSLFHHRITFYN